ncbi:MAG: hypothetical protein J5496_03315 [Lachnospiraceae bacterium]|nr:hypothetical protein [Lachnospiraceae bacterium]
MNSEIDERYSFHNFGYFIFPLKIAKPEVFKTYIEETPDWQLVSEGIKTDYILNYARSMNNPDDRRMQTYSFRDRTGLALYLFEQTAVSKDDPYKQRSGFVPQLEDISLYVFGLNIAFLEFHFLYDGMFLHEIERFNYYFRSLRNDKSDDKKYLNYPADKDSVKAVLEKILPNEQSGTEVCFSNSSDVKQQSLVYTAVTVSPDEDVQRALFLLSHGLAPNFRGAQTRSRYEMQEDFGPKHVWAGCQDGLACVRTDKQPYPFQYDHLRRDYHFMYLLLLNQRYSIISYLDDFRKTGLSAKEEQDKYDEIVTLKTGYSFRTVSDDAYMQTIYSDMYNVLEIDNMIKDLDDANEKINKLVQRRSERSLFALSVLVIFSALVDLSDYLDKWPKGILTPLISLAVITGILFFAWGKIFRKK